MTVDIAEANRLLNEKYADQVGLGNEDPTQFQNKVDDTYLAEPHHNKTLQNDWHEAWKLEKQRADRLEQMLFKQLGLITPEESEVKHTVSSVAQVNRTKANWPQVKRTLEAKFANFGNAAEKEGA